MFSIGDLVIYGTNGVCQVMGVSAPHLMGASDDRLYYELKPYHKDGKIMTPVENQKVPMRAILNEEEAAQLIEEIPDIEMLWIENDKVREAQYKECIRSADCRQWISIIKTLYNRRIERQRQGKRMTATDERYLKQAQDYLYSELSIPLGLPKDKVETFILDNIELRQAAVNG
jgi:CarD family transcriptional regulator